MSKQARFIKKVEDYFAKQELPVGEFKYTQHMTILNARNFVDASIAALKSAKPDSIMFNAASHRLIEFKKYLEQSK